MTVAKSKRIFYFDALRTLAILSVIIVHVYAVTRIHVMADYGMIPSLRWIFSQIAGNCFRIGVPLFLMLAGALSLGRVWTIRDFLGKRIPRIVGPFVFWSLVTGAIAVIISYYFGFTFINSFDQNSILMFGNFAWFFSILVFPDDFGNISDHADIQQVAVAFRSCRGGILFGLLADYLPV